MPTKSDLLLQLLETERLIAHGHSVIDSQKSLIAARSKYGHDVTYDNDLLKSFDRSQDSRHRKLDRVLDALDATAEPSSEERQR